SSDVCSSDLRRLRVHANPLRKRLANPIRASTAIPVLVMPRKTKDNSKSSAEETALNDHAAKPATKKASSPRKTASRKKSAPPKATTHISDEAIRTRAYFIAE